MGNVGNVASGGSDTSGGGSAVRFGSNRGYGVPADLTTYIEFIYGSEVAALETSYIRFGAGEAATLYIIQLQWFQWLKGSTSVRRPCYIRLKPIIHIQCCIQRCIQPYLVKYSVQRRTCMLSLSTPFTQGCRDTKELISSTVAMR